MALAIPFFLAKFAVSGDGERLITVFSIMVFFGCALLSYIANFFINRVFIKVTGKDPELIDDPDEAEESDNDEE